MCFFFTELRRGDLLSKETPSSSRTHKLTSLHYDAIIIGTGQAGVPLAGRLAAAGYQTAIIEKSHFGGTCVNTGCTPTKAYVASARRAYAARTAGELGVTIGGDVRVELLKVKARKDRIVRGSREGIARKFEQTDGLTVYRGEAVFTGPRQVAVNGETLSAERVFLNVGARPRIPEGLAELDYLTNASILELTEIPEHLLVVGGSYVGLEFAQMFRRFGSTVTIVERSDRLIDKEDEDISAAVLSIMQNSAIEVRLGAECISGSRQEGKILLNLDCSEGPSSIVGSHLLLATGRQPNTDRLNSAKAGIELDKHGYIQVNDRLETSAEGVWALGDCNGEGAFTHTAFNDFEIVAANLLDDGDRKVSDRHVCYALYIDPPLGRVGKTEAQARSAGIDYAVASLDMKEVSRAQEMGETQGKMKVLIDKKDRTVIGAAILGIRGDEIVHEFIDLMYAGAPYTVVRDSVPIHPTVSELIPTMLKQLD